MTTEIDLDSILIDGARLKAAREARGTSVAEMASAVTLSREQIQAIEEGGNRPFYTPAHKSFKGTNCWRFASTRQRSTSPMTRS